MGCPGWRRCSHSSPSPETPDLGTQPPGSMHQRINCALIYAQSCLCQEEAGVLTARACTPLSLAPPAPRSIWGPQPGGTAAAAQGGDRQGCPWAGRSSPLRDALCLHKPEQGKVGLILNLNKQGEKAMPELALPGGDAQQQGTAPIAQPYPGTSRAQPQGSHRPRKAGTNPNPKSHA